MEGKIPGIYRHFKGNYYAALSVAKDSETLEEVVVYRALYGEGALWVRPRKMWMEGRPTTGVDRGGRERGQGPIVEARAATVPRGATGRPAGGKRGTRWKSRNWASASRRRRASPSTSGSGMRSARRAVQATAARTRCGAGVTAVVRTGARHMAHMD